LRVSKLLRLFPIIKEKRARKDRKNRETLFRSSRGINEDDYIAAGYGLFYDIGVSTQFIAGKYRNIQSTIGSLANFIGGGGQPSCSTEVGV